MELAVKQQFDVNVVALPPGVDPADDPAGFEAHLRSAEPYVIYRVRLELEHADDREAGFRKAKEIIDAFPQGPDKDAAQRLVERLAGGQFASPPVRFLQLASQQTPRASSTQARVSSGTRSPARWRTKIYDRCSAS